MSTEFVICAHHQHTRQQYHLLCPHVKDKSKPVATTVVNPMVGTWRVGHTVKMCADCKINDVASFASECVECFKERV